MTTTHAAPSHMRRTDKLPSPESGRERPSCPDLQRGGKEETMEKFKKITRKDGTALWKMIESGPRGGICIHYAPFRQGEEKPSPWITWSKTQGKVSDGDRIFPAGTFPHA